MIEEYDKRAHEFVNRRYSALSVPEKNRLKMAVLAGCFIGAKLEIENINKIKNKRTENEKVSNETGTNNDEKPV